MVIKDIKSATNFSMATDNEHLSLFVLRYLARGFNILLLFQNIFQI